ncbi:MAG: Maf family protein [Vulcanimicrobiaceae bacterium]|jgi:septum formation protein
MRELRSIVLASASPRRRELLVSLGLRVRVAPSDVDEGERPGCGPAELALAHARAKSDAAAAREREGVIVAADTVVDLEGKSLGKPRNAAEAAATLAALAGREHIVHTAFVVVDNPGGRRIVRSSSTRVRFAPLSSEQIAQYVATGEPMDKAGAYGIQGRGAALVERIDGDFYTVMGFPLGEFVRSLPELGYVLPSSSVASPA